MSKLLIGLGLLIVMGALFGLLLMLQIKMFPGDKISQETGEGEEPEGKRLRAVVHCTGGGANFSKYRYQGVQDCLAASLVPGGGPLSCAYGCLGMGTCVKVCPVGALSVRDGAAVVDRDLCTACGECVEACPRHIISLEPFMPKKHVSIPCASREQEEIVTEICTDGCIGCNICVGTCPREAVTVEDGLAQIDYEKCDNCGLCAEKCPRHLIAEELVAEPPKPEPPKEKKPREKKKMERVKKLRPLKKEKFPEPVPVEEKPGEADDLVSPMTDGEQVPQEPVDLPVTEPSGPEEVTPAAVEQADILSEQTPSEPTPEEPAEVPAPEPTSEEKTVPAPEPKPDKEEKAPGEGIRSSAEAFKAFEEAVAAAGEALGEGKKETEPAEATDGISKP